MAKEKAKVWIVTMPDGTIATSGLSRISEDHAIAQVLNQWLYPDLFGRIEWGGRWFGALSYIWPAMEKAGWKVHEIEPFGLPTQEPTQ